MEAQAQDEDGLAELDAYDFELPERCIAQSPAVRREQARLMVLDRDDGSVVAAAEDSRVADLPRWLRAGDLLVVNATRVLPARLVGRKASGGAAEALLLGPATRPESSAAGAEPVFRALLKCTGRVREGLELAFGAGGALPARVVAQHERGEVSLLFPPGSDPYAHGVAPLPPYIRRGADEAGEPEGRAQEDRDRYQTVYARAPGAIAAPTAGLHLSESLLAALRDAGIEIAEVVLHVGVGTFRPLDAEALASGRLHSESFELPERTAEAIDRTRERGGRIVAVGTTTTRVLESRARDDGRVQPGAGETDLFLRPGAEGGGFRVVDALLTNFHLPRSSLLMLVAAFVGRAALLAAYREAVAAGFRFYSYGDAMLIVPGAREAR
ncbi:MAG: tRNA preQ1(34) S-adenosylmethionine ribosyltransferase-isomerase QueA, partial [Deltaproteobacteria bacterium]|nr:tRNA preQ1(34) S-adenosylmethionine ribosyltransferase-isomerase QueA [Deltaproteobacteria bacterium]